MVAPVMLTYLTQKGDVYRVVPSSDARQDDQRMGETLEHH
jgi:hypothetical protein